MIPPRPGSPLGSRTAFRPRLAPGRDWANGIRYGRLGAKSRCDQGGSGREAVGRGRAARAELHKGSERGTCGGDHSGTNGVQPVAGQDLGGDRRTADVVACYSTSETSAAGGSSGGGHFHRAGG